MIQARPIISRPHSSEIEAVNYQSVAYSPIDRILQKILTLARSFWPQILVSTAQTIKRMIKMLFRRDPERGVSSVRVGLSHFLSEKLAAMFRIFIQDVVGTQFYYREILVGG
jgi:hypothetical protein